MRILYDLPPNIVHYLSSRHNISILFFYNSNNLNTKLRTNLNKAKELFLVQRDNFVINCGNNLRYQNILSLIIYTKIKIKNATKFILIVIKLT